MKNAWQAITRATPYIGAVALIIVGITQLQAGNHDEGMRSIAEGLAVFGLRDGLTRLGKNVLTGFPADSLEAERKLKQMGSPPAPAP